jgi:hypothetical protein
MGVLTFGLMAAVLFAASAFVGVLLEWRRPS